MTASPEVEMLCNERGSAVLLDIAHAHQELQCVPAQLHEVNLWFSQVGVLRLARANIVALVAEAEKLRDQLDGLPNSQ